MRNIRIESLGDVIDDVTDEFRLHHLTLKFGEVRLASHANYFCR
jgi:hypothetical protein